MGRERFIYGLIDPRDRTLRYVGKTEVGMSRPLEHAKGRGNRKLTNWIRSLRRAGLAYEVAVLEREPKDIDDSEKFWISLARAEAPTRVTNILEGGGGLSYHTYKTKQKLAAASRGKSPSLKTRAKMSAALRGRKLIPERRAKLSAMAKKRGMPKATAEAAWSTLRGRQLSDKHRAKLREAGFRARQEGGASKARKEVSLSHSRG